MTKRRKPPMICVQCRAEKIIGQDQCACGCTMFARSALGAAVATACIAKGKALAEAEKEIQ